MPIYTSKEFNSREEAACIVEPPREPFDLLIAKARKHLTNEEIDKRKESKVKAPSDKIRVPSYLTPALKRELNILAKQLIDVGIMTNLDVDALARFIIAHAMHITLSLQII